ncbi:hypothetical protein HNV11_21500 [Spirosoma taeanense]|uniref:DUF6265 domain-containing protein n=1 Tax=Spirosoma taeanense TaxID=2735870 RepID=A0A6M5YCS5_9BACT|nr:DUF6265 family protein [Spirosoma taeanense]QJW91769.1 hypothetical protein HNV11_21500 [Spirosoma taeanense]
MKTICFHYSIALLVVLFLSASCISYAQTSPKTGTLADMSFLEGHWKGTFNGGPIEAMWMAPAGDNFAGFIRMMKDNRITMYEILVYEQTERGPVSLVKHFKPGLIGQEEKEKSDRYQFLEGSKDRALLEKEDGSIRIIYEKRGPDQLVIQRGQSKDGKWVFNDLFVFNRVR